MITGARQGKLNRIRQLIAAAMARDLTVFIVPGPEIALAYNLDIEASGLQPVASPRHASTLLLIGTISPALLDAAAICYAQMPRPRALFTVGSEIKLPLPHADIRVDLNQRSLNDGVQRLRQLFATDSFRTDVTDFDAPVLQVQIEFTCPMHPEVISKEPGKCPKCGMFLIERETQAKAVPAEAVETASHTDTCHHHTHDNASMQYTCPMHPEVVQDEPGSCPKCGMDLMPAEAQAEPVHEHQHGHHDTHEMAAKYTCPMHPEVVQDDPGSCPKCGMDLMPAEAQTEPADEHQHGHHDTHEMAAKYTCPMHPEVVQDEPGSCPKCGMDLMPIEGPAKAADNHNSMDHDHDDMGFMSMIDVTKDLPRSGDGLQMEWIDAPFGPFFPGLPGGLLLDLTLDGDTIAASNVHALVDNSALLTHSTVSCDSFVKKLADFSPFTPVAYRQLACLTLEAAAKIDIPSNTAIARIGALERERIASHLGWLVLFAQQSGFDWLAQRAASLQLAVRHSNLQQITALSPDILKLKTRLHRTPLLKAHLRGIGQLSANATFSGPVARAANVTEDARNGNEYYKMLDFSPASQTTGDALARLNIRLEEMRHSLQLIKASGSIALPEPENISNITAFGEAVVETPRGSARLQLNIDSGMVISASLETPCNRHLDLVQSMIDQQELGDALVAVNSLDISPWEALP